MWLSVPGPHTAADALESPVSATHTTIQRQMPMGDGVEAGVEATVSPSAQRGDIGGESTTARPMDRNGRTTSGVGRPAPLAFSHGALERSVGGESRATDVDAPRHAVDRADVTGGTGQRRGKARNPSADEKEAASRTNWHEPFSMLVVPYAPGDPEHPATIPAVLADVVPTPVTSDPAMTTEVNQVEAAFLNRIVSGSEDPLDPEFQQRWLEAQEESDARLKSSLGGHAWLDRHRAVHRQAREGRAEVGGRRSTVGNQ